MRIREVFLKRILWFYGNENVKNVRERSAERLRRVIGEVKTTRLSINKVKRAYAAVEIKPNFPLAWGMSSPEKLLDPRKNH